MKHRKLLLSIIISAFVLTISPHTMAAEMTWKYDESNAVMSIKGYGMINEGKPLVEYIDKVKKIVLQKGVTKIEKNVFADCGSVEEVVLPDGFVSLGNNSFSFSKNLEKINFPSTLETIGDEAFMGCSALENVVIPAKVNYIGANAFAECYSLTDFDVSKDNPNYTAVDGVIFSKDKTELIMYPAGRESESYSIPSGTVKIHSKAFAYNTYLENVTIPDTVDEIDDYAFYFCEELRDVEFGSGVKTIGSYSFYGSDIKNVFVPYGCTKIGASAFKNCGSLELVNIPGTVTEMGDGVFYGTSDSLEIRGYGNAAKKSAADCGRKFGETLRVLVNGKEIHPERPAFAKNGCTMVPMRSIFEALSADVEWNNDTKTASAKKDGTVCSFKIGDSKLYRNGEAVTLLAPAEIVGSSTFVHVRAIANAFGADVQWAQETGLVNITL